MLLLSLPYFVIEKRSWWMIYLMWRLPKICILVYLKGVCLLRASWSVIVSCNCKFILGDLSSPFISVSELYFVSCYLICFMESRSSSNGSTEEEETLAMVKPDGVLGNYTERIKNAVVESGFSIIRETVIQLDEHRASTFYVEHSSKSFFSSLVKYMTR